MPKVIKKNTINHTHSWKYIKPKTVVFGENTLISTNRHRSCDCGVSQKMSVNPYAINYKKWE